MDATENILKSFQPRAEMCAHTKFGLMDSCADVYSLFEHAKERGITAIAITDTNSVRAFPYAEFAAKKFGIKLIYGCELLMTDGEAPVRILTYVQTQNGLKNLYRLLSLALERKDKTVTREEVESYRKGLLIAGSEEIINEGLRGADILIRKIAEFYDAIPVTISDIALLPEIAAVGDDAERPVFLVSDVRYLDEEDKLAYEILTDKSKDASEKHHLKTSSDLFEECDELFCEDEKSLVQRLVCDNTLLFAGRFTEQIRLFPDPKQASLSNVYASNEPEERIGHKASEMYDDPIQEDPIYTLVTCTEAAMTDSTKAYSLIYKWQKKHRIRLTQEEGSIAIRALDGIVRGELEIPDRYLPIPNGQDALDYGPVCSGVLRSEINFSWLQLIKPPAADR